MVPPVHNLIQARRNEAHGHAHAQKSIEAVLQNGKVLERLKLIKQRPQRPAPALFPGGGMLQALPYD